MEYIYPNLPNYTKITSRAETSSALVSSGAVLLFSEDGNTLTAKHPDGTYTTVGGGGSQYSSTTAQAGDVLDGKLFINSVGVVTTGTIPSVTPESSGSTVNIASGYLASPVSIVVSGGVDVSDTTATPADVLSGALFHDSTGALVSGGILTYPASTYTPTTSAQYIPAGVYLGGSQTIAGDANLVASNIVSGATIFGVTGTASGGGPVIPTSGLVFHAPLASATSQAATGQTMTLSGVSFTSQSGVTAASFDGSAYVSVPNAALPSGTSARTVSIWARQEATGSIYIIWHSGGDDDIGLFIDARNGAGRIAAGTADVDINVASLSDYQYWRNIVIRYASGTAEIFVDGALIGSASITLDTTLDGTAYIGADDPDTFRFVGHIAAVRVYNRALSREEIQALATELHPTD